MTFFARTRWLAPLVILIPVVAIAAGRPPPTGNRVFDRTVEIVGEKFYSPAGLPAFYDAVAAADDGLDARSGPAAVDAAIVRVLGALGASHTGRFTRDRIDYYELADVFRFALRRDMRRMFPPDGTVAYDGVGIATRAIDGRVFVTDVYDGAPAAGAGILVGDEILSVDGKPFDQTWSFRGRSGETAAMRIRRAAGAGPAAVRVPIERLEPTATFLKAIDASIRVLVRDGHRIGTVRLWSWTDRQVGDILAGAIGGGALADVDGLVLDLRGRWGGAPPDAAELFVGDAADMRTINRDGDVDYANQRWRKPLVAIVDEGTRSGMEILAFGLKKNGVPLVGTPTAGAVLAATAFVLPDDSLLEVAVLDVLVDGARLEGAPVEPDIAVPFDIRYAAGDDPQFEAALAEMAAMLSSGAGSLN